MATICFITNLPVWSLGEGRGAPSFYKTIELYQEKGHSVTFITTEDIAFIAKLGGVNVVKMPALPILGSRLFLGFLRLISKHLVFMINQILGFAYLIRNGKNAELIYAYEIGFVPAAWLYSKAFRKAFVARYQGTVLTGIVRGDSWHRIFYKCVKYFDHIVSLRCRADIIIMTDDGTMGDRVLRRITYRKRNIVFLRNGVDLPEQHELDVIKPSIVTTEEIRFCSVSRLQAWKRIDRSLLIFSEVAKKRKDVRYTICGDGATLASSISLAAELGLADRVKFLGSLTKDAIYVELLRSHFFLSSYELSNLGNPLFEAIACDSLVVTLNNGETESLIVDGVTGVLSSEDSYLENAEKILALVDDKAKQRLIKEQAKQALTTNFMSWRERMDCEYQHVSRLFVKRI